MIQAKKNILKSLLTMTMVVGCCCLGLNNAQAAEVNSVDLEKYELISTRSVAEGLPQAEATITDEAGNVTPVEVDVNVYKSKAKALSNTGEMVDQYVMTARATSPAVNDDIDGGYRCHAYGSIYFEQANLISSRITAVSGDWVSLDSGFMINDRSYSWKSGSPAQSGSNTNAPMSFYDSVSTVFQSGTLTLDMSCYLERGTSSERFTLSVRK